MATKLRVKLGSGPTASEHEIEIGSRANGADAGETQCRLDSEAPMATNWVRVAPNCYSILLGSRSYDAHVTPAAGAVTQREYTVRVGSESFHVEIVDPRAWQGRGGLGGAHGPQEINAPMPGKVVKLLVAEGDEVGDGQGLLVIEAMKMQNELKSPRPGRVERIYAAEGAGVESGAPLVRLGLL
ncbi:MAG TPA: biotin/lipoyl-containing protein [Terriglobia bacterium]|nr:biotin/lipoyl-containing protein [Terriglobia bacterium]